MIGEEDDPAVAPNVGWNTGAGFDYQFAASPWHINGQARYGQSKGSSSAAPLTFSEASTDENGNPTTESGAASTSASLTETHWLIDFGAGYGVPFGHSSLQLNFGIRTVYLTADTTSPAAIGLSSLDPMATPPDPTSTVGGGSSNTVQKSAFLGAGPRFGVEGSVPFGNFSFDYAADAAWLIGSTRINSETTTNFTVVSLPVGSGTNISESGLTSSSTYERTVSVYNGDFLIGVSYWFTPAFKITLDYRLDAYFSPLRTFGTNGSALAWQWKWNRRFAGPYLSRTGNCAGGEILVPLGARICLNEFLDRAMAERG